MLVFLKKITIHLQAFIEVMSECYDRIWFLCLFERPFIGTEWLYRVKGTRGSDQEKKRQAFGRESTRNRQNWGQKKKTPNKLQLHAETSDKREAPTVFLETGAHILRSSLKQQNNMFEAS